MRLAPSQADAQPTGSADPGLPSPDQWHRVHKVTPLLNAWKAAVLLAGAAMWNLSDELAALDQSLLVKALLVLGLIALGSLIGLGYGVLSWQRMRYAISPESVLLHSGVLWRQQRHLRLDRIQAVDVTQPLLARIFGFASLKIESAGSGSSNLTLSYLTEAEAQRLRNEILARAAGVAFDESPEVGVRAQAPLAPEQQLLELSPGRLVGSLLLSGPVLVTILGVIGLASVTIFDGPTAILGLLVPWLLGVGGFVLSWFGSEFGFRLATSADGLRLRHGLLETKARTVPPGRVQAIAVDQRLFWRRFGWWRVQVNIAGYGVDASDGTDFGAKVLYPVATAEEVYQILSLVLPDLGTDQPIEVLAAGMTGRGDRQGFITSPRRMRTLDPLTWRHTGLRVTDSAVLLRRGRWWRSLTLVPHERTQSMALEQGPLERRYRVATVQLHSTPGPVVPALEHIDVDVARTFLVEQAQRARAARRGARPARWMQSHPEPVRSAPQMLRSSYGGVLPNQGGRR
ncbi:MAG: PH domain-containing protein [Beutenbergiaceae bacterium]